MTVPPREEYLMRVGHWEARVVQVGDIARQWSVDVRNVRTGELRRLTADDIDPENASVFNGDATPDRAQRRAERLLREVEPASPMGQWELIDRPK